MTEHVILVALTVEGGTRNLAQITVMNNLPKPGQVITSWWIAEDDRLDRSDNDSAVFVPRGAQQDVASLLDQWVEAHRDEWNEDGYPYAETDVSGAWFGTVEEAVEE